VVVKETWPTSLQWADATGHGEMAMNWNIGSSAPVCEGNFPQQG